MAPSSFEQPLNAEAMRSLMASIMRGERSPEEIREFLTVLARRGETAEEIAAGVEALRAHAVPLPLSQSYALCDTCGTGGDRQGTINVSTLAALIAAACGVRIAKHGNRAASSQCGSADLLEALGVNLQASPVQVARCIEEVGFGFCFAPAFHPAMKVVAPVRKALGVRTIFNLLGPLANPAPLTYQLVGVSEPRLLRPMAEALVRLGIRHGLVVHGDDGLDEVTTTTTTAWLEVRDGAVTPGSFEPSGYGISRATRQALCGGDAARNAAIAREVLAGTPSAARELVLVNAACAIYVADQVPTIAEGLHRAREVLEQGAAMAILERVKDLSHAR